MLKTLRKKLFEEFPAIARWHRQRKQRQRKARFASDLWQQRDRNLARRRYASYEEYLTHQASKLDNIYARRVAKEADAEATFRRRFLDYEPLRGARNVLCLGARLGAEVKALRSLNYFAVGLDLNPGKDNPYVFYGDLHQLTFGAGSVDAIYTNVLDHVYDLPRLIGEVSRVLKPEGIFIADIGPGFEEGYLPGEYEATYWPRTEALIQTIVATNKLRRLEQRPGEGATLQVAFKPCEKLPAATAEADGQISRPR